MELWAYFTDPVLRGPMWGTLFLCLTLGLAGVFVFFQKKSLVGEVLSHAAYPGVLFGLLFFQCTEMRFEVLFFALLSCLLALLLIRFLMTRASQDVSLTFTLASFFGLGILLLSLLQFSCGYLGRLAESFFFGQAATMGDSDIWHYGLLALVICLFFALFYKEIKCLLFDAQYAKVIGIPVQLFTALFLGIALVALVAGIRSVGVVLISAMLIAPVIAARQFTHKFGAVLLLAPLFGVLSALLGNMLSFELSRIFSQEGNRLVIPTGPTIVLIASLFALFSLFFSPYRGIVSIAVRLKEFRAKRNAENLLKYLYRHPYASLGEVRSFFSTKEIRRLRGQGYLDQNLKLTDAGEERAIAIIRSHRLWEVYLVQMMGKGEAEVHDEAEEMEHILTPEMEETLTRLLNDPPFDPHHQPIPRKKGGV